MALAFCASAAPAAGANATASVTIVTPASVRVSASGDQVTCNPRCGSVDRGTGQLSFATAETLQPTIDRQARGEWLIVTVYSE